MDVEIILDQDNGAGAGEKWNAVFAIAMTLGRLNGDRCRESTLNDRDKLQIAPPLTGDKVAARLPLWVHRATLTVRRLLPVFPYEQTSIASVGMSQKCQFLPPARPPGHSPEGG